MARIKGGLNAKKKHNRTLKLAKGYRGARSKQYRVAKQSVMRALTSSYYKENLKAEFYIPTMVNKLVGEGTASLRVLRSAAQWHGVTYTLQAQGKHGRNSYSSQEQCL